MIMREGTGVRRRLRIGIDGGCWLNRRGYGRYTRSLLAALAKRDDGDQYILFIDRETAAAPDLPPRFEQVIVPTSQPPAQAASASGRRSVRDLFRMGWAVARYPLDAFFFPSVYTFFPLLRPVRTVVAIHDVIAERHPHMVFARRRFAWFWRIKVSLAVRQARLLLTVSEYAHDSIVAHFRLPTERVRVVLEAPDPMFRPLDAPRAPTELLPSCALPPESRYVLYVGGLSPHKNLPVLIEAYRRLHGEREFSDLRLLLVGDYSGDVFLSAYDELRATVERGGLVGRVHFTGFVPDEALVDLYNRAELLVLPSIEEGFGLPALEAVACGTPVVVSETGPISALLGPAAWAFPSHDTGALTEGLRMLLHDPARRHAMRTEGLRRAANFTWDRAAAQVHALFHELTGG